MGSGAAEPPFARLAIVGLGLIGGSIALAARRAWPALAIVGVDRPEPVERARRRGAIDESRASVAELADADLIVLATPVPAILEAVAELGAGSPDALVTDVGSTKRRVLEAAARAGLRRFVGGHPMAGAERRGVEHARADLFEGCPWVLVEPAGGAPEAMVVLERFVAGLGAVPHRFDATSHDRVMAYVSHLPQLLAVALMNAAAAGCGESGLGASGRAFREMTRLAESPADLWRGILSTNGDFIAEAVGALIARLPSSERELVAGAALEAAFEEAGRWRRRLDHEQPQAR
jgi:prephenate dehydrogenase